MKIALITTHMNIGGISVYVASLAEALALRGHDLTVISSGGDLIENLKEKNIKHIEIDIDTKSELSPKVFKAISILKKRFRVDKPDIIHAHTRIAQVISFFISRSLNIPYVTTCHGFFKPRISRRLFKCWGDIAIAISGPVAEHLKKDFGVSPRDIRVVYNGIDTCKFSKVYSESEKDEFKKGLGFSASDFIIGIIARLSDVKGHLYLIEALNIILKNGFNVKMLIIGDGPMKKQLFNLSHKLGLDDNVVFAQACQDTRVALSIIDIFAMPSLQEGLGLAILEAASMARPIVATNVGGIPTIIKDKDTGLLVNPRDPKALALAIIDMIKDEGLRKSLGNNARNFVLGNFSLDKMCNDIEKVYTQAIEGPNK